MLNEYPELEDELEEELKKMEKENAAMKAELEELQNRLEEAQRTEDELASSTGGSEPAFVNADKTPKIDEQDAEDNQANLSSIEDDMTADDDLVITESSEDDKPDDSIATDEGQDDLDSSSSDTQQVNTTSTDVTTKPQSTSSEDFTLTHLAFETLRAFVQHAKDDAKRLFGMMVPVVQPLLNVGDAAWRQIKALFFKAREYYVTDETDTKTDDNEKTSTTAEVEGSDFDE